MKIRLFAAAALAAAGMAGAANAAVTISGYSGNYIKSGFTLITDFDSDQSGLIVASGYDFTQNYNAYTRDGGLGLDSGNSAPPPLNGPANPASPAPNGKNYETVKGNGLATLTSVAGFKRFSFYMGSPDDWNQVRITYSDNSVEPLSGSAIWGGTPPGNGDQTYGTTVVYNFNGKTATKIEFFNNPTNNAFEFDRLAASAAVPEPATWALMIGGFGLMGSALRGQRRRSLTLAA